MLEAERAVLATLEGGCAAPIGALAEVAESDPEDDETTELWVRAVALSPDGTRVAYVDALDRKVRLTVKDGTFEKVAVAGPGGQALAGRMVAGKTRWVSQAALKPGTRYTVQSTAVDADGLEKSFTSAFSTRKLSLDLCLSMTLDLHTNLRRGDGVLNLVDVALQVGLRLVPCTEVLVRLLVVLSVLDHLVDLHRRETADRVLDA